MNRAMMTLALLLSGCVGGPEAEDHERAAGAATLWRAYLSIDLQTTKGWGREGWGSATGWINRGEARVDDPRHDLDDVGRTVTLHGTRHAIQVAGGGKLELSVQSLRLGDVQPPLGKLHWIWMAIYHRPSGSRSAWQPMKCQSYFDRTEFELPIDHPFDLYQEKVTIDLAARTVSAGIDQGPFSEPAPVDDTFERCGIKEAYPEFAALAVPAANAFYIGTPVNLDGRYPYQVRAECNDYWCWTYDGGADGARAADETAGRDPSFVLESCENGVDDDADGLVDCEDTECHGVKRWTQHEPGGVRSGYSVCPGSTP